jgi:hypothetical protein
VEAGASASDHALPFHPDSEAPALVNTDNPGVPADHGVKGSLPFRNRPRSIPFGTLVTVRLENSLSETEARAGEKFSAVVAEPVIVDGDTLIGTGTAVMGRVESEHPFGISGPGYVRLALDAIVIDGKQLLLQTSSLFAHGSLPQPYGATPMARMSLPPAVVVFPKGRRLTFRLTSAVPLGDQSPIADRRYSAPRQ